MALPEAGEAARGRVALGTLGALGVLVAWNAWARPALPGRWHLLGSLLVAALLLGIARLAGLSRAELGLERSRLGAGARLGAVAMLLVGAVVVAASLLPATRGFFSGHSRADVSFARLSLEVLVTIPIGTALVEELCFRGVLLGLFRRSMSAAWAVAASSLLFGAWHLQPVIADTAGSPTRVALAALGTFAATSAAGVGFAWLRLRSGSLLAPIMAHVATNSISLAAAWAVAH